MSLEATSLLGVMASISSMNKMQGAELCRRQGRQGGTRVRVKRGGRTYHRLLKQLPELLLRLPGDSRHHLWSRDLQHGQLQLLQGQGQTQAWFQPNIYRALNSLN